MNTEQYDWQSPHVYVAEAAPDRPARRADVALVALLMVALSVLAAGITVTLRASAGYDSVGHPAVTVLDER